MMSSTIPRRHTIRFREYDYASEGLYFVTICTAQRASRFGNIVDAKMNLNDTGKIVEEVWSSMFLFLDDADTWIVMPNHVRGIVAIGDGTPRVASTKKPLGRLVGAFKTVTTKRINEIRGIDAAIWQRNFYEHILRDDRSFEQVVAYINDNPARWEADPENPNRTPQSDAIGTRQIPRVR
jgi:putative transposase